VCDRERETDRHTDTQTHTDTDTDTDTVTDTDTDTDTDLAVRGPRSSLRQSVTCHQDGRASARRSTQAFYPPSDWTRDVIARRPG